MSAEAAGVEEALTFFWVGGRVQSTCAWVQRESYANVSVRLAIQFSYGTTYMQLGRTYGICASSYSCGRWSWRQITIVSKARL